jgi:hypothetical protein
LGLTVTSSEAARRAPFSGRDTSGPTKTACPMARPNQNLRELRGVGAQGRCGAERAVTARHALMELASQKSKARISPRPHLTGARGTSARAAIRFYVVGQPLSVMRRILSSGERLVFPRRRTERPVPFRINGVSKFAVICWKHGDDRTHPHGRRLRFRPRRQS